MIESTFVTFGNAIASAQVTVTKAAVSMKFLKIILIQMYLRFLVIVRLSENECEELVSERIIVAGKGCKYD
jgi:hypothetical protein